MNDFFTEINIDNRLLVIKSNNISDEIIKLNTKRKGLNVQFHFNLDKNIWFYIIKGTHKLQMSKNDSLFFFNPKNIIPIDAVIEPGGKMLSFMLSLEAINRLLDNFAIDISFFNPQNKRKKLYDKRQLTANELIVINQIYNRKIQNSMDIVYLKAKIIEFFSYYFNQENTSNTDCKKLQDEKVIEKIKKAKQILIENINEPPPIDQLANMVFLPVNVLKKGFKEIYGAPVYKYILNYKLELARHLLLSNKYSVKEVSYQMGYSAPTHFIVAFKKKFGITPKKLIQ
jgi:AraC-like DNA-binding protein